MIERKVKSFILNRVLFSKKSPEIKLLQDLNLSNLNCIYRVPRFSCSLSIDSNNALKFPAPNPRAPILWMIS